MFKIILKNCGIALVGLTVMSLFLSLIILSTIMFLCWINFHSNFYFLTENIIAGGVCAGGIMTAIMSTTIEIG